MAFEAKVCTDRGGYITSVRIRINNEYITCVAKKRRNLKKFRRDSKNLVRFIKRRCNISVTRESIYFWEDYNDDLIIQLSYQDVLGLGLTRDERRYVQEIIDGEIRKKYVQKPSRDLSQMKLLQRYHNGKRL